MVAQSAFSAHSLLAEGRWWKMAVNADGIYCITVSDIAALDGVSLDSIALFGGRGGMLPSSNMAAHSDDLLPCAVKFLDHNDNGRFDASDSLLFYGESPHVWRYVEQEQRFEYNVHAYANFNYYYLTIGNHVPLRVSNVEMDDSDISSIQQYTAVALRHLDHVNTHGGGRIWVDEKFTHSLTDHAYSLSLPAVPSSGSVLARYAFASISDRASSFSVTVGSSRRQISFPPSTRYLIALESFTGLSSRLVEFQCTYRPSDANAAGYLDFIELNAQVPLAYSGGALFVRNKLNIAPGAKNRFQVSGNGQRISVWDVSNPTQPQSLFVRFGNGSFSFDAFTEEAGTYLIYTASDLSRPASIETISNQDLHGAQVPDYLIVCHHDYLQQAERLADLHRIREGLDVLVTTQEEVFNEFSSGKPDPVALRQLLRCWKAKASDSMSFTRYLLLFGKGTYDNRDILGAHQTTVLTYQSQASFDDEGDVYPSDDFYGHLDDYAAGDFDGKVSIAIGRLPAKSKAEADWMVDKIENYMVNSDLQKPQIRGDWRNYVCLLADDADPSCSPDTCFASDSEITARLIRDRYPNFNLDRIYADSYPQQSGADGSYYPDVNNALQQRLNYGCLLLNYIGHGSSSYIGTERFMQLTDIDKYSNHDRLAFFVTSTCSFGRYDQLTDICGAEAFLLADAAGVGVVAAARPIHHVQAFNTNLCLFALDPVNTVGDALRYAKNATSTAHSILLLGDPALHLSIPRNDIVVTHINGIPVDSARIDSLTVLSQVTVTGEVRRPDGSLYDDFDGVIFPIVFDREVSCRTLANDNDSTEIDFVQQKNILYKGRENVTGGKFSYTFTIPRDVSYQYGPAKFSHYAHSDIDNASGQYGNIRFGGFNEDVIISELHPSVELWMDSPAFHDGALTNETPTLYARLTDSVGINAAGSGLGHDITAVIDGNPFSTITLNDFFEPDILDSRNGDICYTLGKLNDGLHTLTLKCWNIFNFSGSATISFRVANDRNPQIGAVIASPNPAHDRTLIRVDHNLAASLASVTIDVYDIRGQRVRTFVPVVSGGSMVAVSWDFTSSSGALLPSGIYLVRAVLTTADGSIFAQHAKIVRN